VRARNEFGQYFIFLIVPFSNSMPHTNFARKSTRWLSGRLEMSRLTLFYTYQRENGCVFGNEQKGGGIFHRAPYRENQRPAITLQL
jgi:hypothetical protein